MNIYIFQHFNYSILQFIHYHIWNVNFHKNTLPTLEKIRELAASYKLMGRSRDRLRSYAGKFYIKRITLHLQPIRP